MSLSATGKPPLRVNKEDAVMLDGIKPTRPEAQRLTEEAMKKQLYVDPIDPLPDMPQKTIAPGADAEAATQDK